MAAYLNQSEATTYKDAVGLWTASQAVAYLTAASSVVDQYCGRTFTSTDVTPDVKLAVVLVADYLKNSGGSAGVKTSEKVGDWSATYQVSGSNLPEIVESLLQPYKVMVMG